MWHGVWSGDTPAELAVGLKVPRALVRGAECERAERAECERAKLRGDAAAAACGDALDDQKKGRCTCSTHSAQLNECTEH